MTQNKNRIKIVYNNSSLFHLLKEQIDNIILNNAKTIPLHKCDNYTNVYKFITTEVIEILLENEGCIINKKINVYDFNDDDFSNLYINKLKEVKALAKFYYTKYLWEKINVACDNLPKESTVNLNVEINYKTHNIEIYLERL